MKCLIAGSRTITDYSLVEEAVHRSGFVISEVVSGTAPGADRLGELWALRNGVPVRRFPADWSRFGRAAGIMRNDEMVAYAGENGALIAVWDQVSRGTRHTIEEARRRGLKVFVLPVGRALKPAPTWARTV